MPYGPGPGAYGSGGYGGYSQTPYTHMSYSYHHGTAQGYGAPYSPGPVHDMGGPGPMHGGGWDVCISVCACACDVCMYACKERQP